MDVVALVTDCIIIALELLCWWYVLRYNLHTFQQNSYKALEQLRWLRGAWMRQDVLLVGLGTTALAVWTPFEIFDLIAIVVWGFALYYFHFLSVYLSKKPLVFTARVKRMIFTDAVLSLAAVVAAFVMGGHGVASFVLACVVTCQMFIVLLANLINQPVERAINQHYINEAKQLLADCPNLDVIGVTGSFGKTSVKSYLDVLLKDRFDLLVTPGNFNTTLGVVKTVRASLRRTNELFICEMGARYVGDIKEICDLVHPRYGVVTAIGPQHLDTFGDLEAIKRTKFELVDALPADGVAFLNYDNEHVRAMAEGRPNVVAYGTTDEAAAAAGERGLYRAVDIALSSHGTSFTLLTPSGESCDYQMRLVGGHNVVNVVGALAVAHELGVPLASLRTSVRKLRPVEHRMAMREQGGATIIDDAYNSNPIGSRAAVETLAMFEGTHILVTPGMVELGADQDHYNYEFGKVAATCCDYIAIVGKENREALQRGVRDGGIAAERVRTFNRVEDAISYAYTVGGDAHRYILLENDLPDIY